MLFNKSNNGIEELKEHLGFIYTSNNFNNIRTELKLAQSALEKTAGKEIFAAAEAHYHSNNYQLPSPTAQQKVLDGLVHAMQLPIALAAYLDYAPSADLIHDTMGRRIAYEENTMAARQWQIDHSEAAIQKRANQATDALFEYLEENAATLTDWTNSPAYKQARALFISNADQLQANQPIDHSRTMYVLCQPFIKHAEVQSIKPALGATAFADLKTAWQARNITAEQKSLIEDYIQPTLAAFAIMQAIQKLPVKVLPTGIVQTYRSERETTKSSQPALTIDRATAIQALRDEANSHLARLYQKIKTDALAQAQTEQTEKTECPTKQKFFRV